MAAAPNLSGESSSSASTTTVTKSTTTTSTNSVLGFSVALSEDGLILASGNPHENYVQVYQWTNNRQWTLLGNTIQGNVNSQFGNSIDMSQSSNGVLTLVVGAPMENEGMGAVFVY